jgi:uncharacterized protein YceK
MDVNMLKAFVGLCLLMLLSGCASTVKMYDGSQRPSSEVASILSWRESRWSLARGSPLGALIVHPMVIDGQPTNATPNDGKKTKYSVLPGEHRIKVVLFWNVGFLGLKVVDPEEIVFNAEAGHSYLTKAYAPNDWLQTDPISFWVEDADTQKVVSRTVADSKLQEDFVRSLTPEASMQSKECTGQVLRAEPYRSAPGRVINERGWDALRLEMSLRDENKIRCWYFITPARFSGRPVPP